VVGGGPIGCELAQALARFGSRVMVHARAPLFLPKEERDAAQMVSAALARDGVEVHLNTTAVNVRVAGGKKYVETIERRQRRDDCCRPYPGGHRPRSGNRGAETGGAGVVYDARTGIHVDDFLRTTNRRVYAAGDRVLEHQFVDTADASARIVVRNALLLGRKRNERPDNSLVHLYRPGGRARGLYVKQARERGIPVKTYTVPMHEVDRAIADGEEDGLSRSTFATERTRSSAPPLSRDTPVEMINGISLAMVAGIGLRTVARVIHTYPTQADAIKMAAEAHARSRSSSFVGWLSRQWVNR
jgi:pyruvate/2-oxoglutarate dehydrogenase complex dihydrolipoamide dehydrogenase (E3) component